jgi:D-methionine transport system permease protein
MLFSSNIWLMIGEGIIDTLYMVLFSTAFAYVFGMPIAIALVVTRKDGLRPMPMVNMVIDTVVNILRSVPFLILMILVTPLMRLIAGKGYGPTATIVALVVAAAPYVARMIESSLLEVDPGVIEAALSMGASTRTIIFKVLLPEAKTSLIVGCTISIGTILGAFSGGWLIDHIGIPGMLAASVICGAAGTFIVNLMILRITSPDAPGAS